MIPFLMVVTSHDVNRPAIWDTHLRSTILDPPSWISLVAFLALSQVIAESDTELMQDPYQMSK